MQNALTVSGFILNELSRISFGNLLPESRVEDSIIIVHFLN